MLSTGMLKVNRIKIGEVYILFIKKLTNYSDSMTRVNSQVCMHACVLGDHCADLVANCDTKLRQNKLKCLIEIFPICLILILQPTPTCRHGCRYIFKNFERKVVIILFSYRSVYTFVLGAQKNCLIETVQLSTYNIFC